MAWLRWRWQGRGGPPGRRASGRGYPQGGGKHGAQLVGMHLLRVHGGGLGHAEQAPSLGRRGSSSVMPYRSHSAARSSGGGSRRVRARRRATGPSDAIQSLVKESVQARRQTGLDITVQAAGLAAEGADRDVDPLHALARAVQADVAVDHAAGCVHRSANSRLPNHESLASWHGSHSATGEPVWQACGTPRGQEGVPALERRQPCLTQT